MGRARGIDRGIDRDRGRGMGRGRGRDMTSSLCCCCVVFKFYIQWCTRKPDLLLSYSVPYTLYYDSTSHNYHNHTTSSNSPQI